MSYKVRVFSPYEPSHWNAMSDDSHAALVLAFKWDAANQRYENEFADEVERVTFALTMADETDAWAVFRYLYWYAVDSIESLAKAWHGGVSIEVIEGMLADFPRYFDICFSCGHEAKTAPKWFRTRDQLNSTIRAHQLPCDICQELGALRTEVAELRAFRNRSLGMAKATYARQKAREATTA